MRFFWQQTPVGGVVLGRDPWSWWVRLRPGTNAGMRAFFENTGANTPGALEALGWKVPAVYGSDAPFFTAQQSIQGFVAGTTQLPDPGGPGIGSNPGLFHVTTELRMSLVRDLERAELGKLLHTMEFSTKGLPAWGLPQANLQLLRDVLKAPPSLLETLGERTSPSKDRARTPGITAPAAGKSAAPVIGIIDTTIAFLHKSFRDTDGTSRFIALWDQSESAPLAAPWMKPADMGYGRELDGAAISQLLTKLSAPGASEEVVYKSVIQPVLEWSHGTLVLALAAAQPEPVKSNHLKSTDPDRHTPDAAGAAAIVAVQLPEQFVDATHGNWLSSAILDALHYILAKAPVDAPVVVNISLSSQSGPRDGTSLLERAIDALIKAQNGRLAVVVAAGNARRSRAHSRHLVEPGQAVELMIDPPSQDPTPTFMEAWCENADQSRPHDMSMEVSLEVKGVSAALVQSSPPVTVDAATTSMSVMQLKHESAAGNQSDEPVALLCVSGPGQSPNGQTGVQLLAGVAPMRGLAGSGLANAPPGRWCLRVSNKHGSNPLLVNGWVARDDSVGGKDLTRRPEQPFTAEMESAISNFGTMSNLAWATQVIAVGGYITDRHLNPLQMDLDSGAGFEPGLPEARRRQRVGPDLCAPARVGNLGVAAVAFLSGGYAAITKAIGTSMAAPMVTRQLVNVLFHERSFLTKSALLAKLKTKNPPPAINDPARSGPQWLQVR